MSDDGRAGVDGAHEAGGDDGGGAGSDGGFDRSLADLMAGVAVVFLLLAAIFILRANQAKQEAVAAKDVAVAQKRQLEERVDGQKEKVSRALAKLHDELTALDRRMGGGFLKVSDVPKNGLNELDVEFVNFTFDFGRCRTPDKKLPILHSGAVPMVHSICDAVATIQGAGAQPSIVLEGHTDDRPFSVSSPECGVVSAKGSAFDNNVRASASRAQSVFFTIRNELTHSPAQLQCLDRYFVVSGRGQASPLRPDNPSSEANRRLVIHVRGDLRL